MKNTKKLAERPASRSQEVSLGRHGPWFLLVGLAVILIYYLLHSPKPYDDDNIGRYFMTQAAPSKPEFFVNAWGRPLAILFFLGPSYLGYWYCASATLLLTLGTITLTYLAAKRSGRNYAWLSIPFLGLQPLFLSTGFSLCTEPLAAFCLALGLFFHYRNQETGAALAWSLAPLARTELALLLPIFAFDLFRRKQYVHILLLGTGLVLYQIAGMVITHDPLFLWTTAGSFGHGLYPNGPFDHYFKRFIFIVGPIVFTFMMVQLVLDLRSRKISLINSSIVLIFCMHVYFYWKGNVASIGFLRHFVAISPLMALYALDGFNSAFDHRLDTDKVRRLWVTIALLFVVLVTLTYYSFDLVGDYFVSEQKEFLKFFLVGGAALVFGIFQFQKVRSLAFLQFILLYVVLGSAAYTLAKEKPLTLQPEHQTVREFYDVFVREYKKDAPKVMVSHSWFFFFDNANDYLPDAPGWKYVRMRTENLDSLPVGSLVVWDSHYSWRLTNNVQQEAMLNDKRFRMIRQFISTDRKFGILLFEKISM
jgi:hypothetical protein